MIRGLGGCLIAPCRHQQGGKRKSEAFYAEHDCASTAHARLEGQSRGKWHSLSITPSFSVGCQTFNRVFLTKASTLTFINGLCRFPGSSIFQSYGLDEIGRGWCRDREGT